MTQRTLLTVRLTDQTRTIAVDGPRIGQPLTALLRQVDAPLNTRCGQRGLCDGCLIELVSGDLIEITCGTTVRADGEPRVVQGCQHCLPSQGEVTIRVPDRSLLAHEPQVVTSFRVNVSRTHDPLWQRVVPDENALDVAATAREAARRAAIRRGDGNLPVRLAAGSWDASVPQAGFVVEHVGDAWSVRPAEAADADAALGIAVDVGTTTVVAVLVDLATGEVLNTASALNGQVRLGDNVVTRIQLCVADPKMVERLQRAVVGRTLRFLFEQLVRESRMRPEQIRTLVVAGNTIMLHLVAGIDPSSMGTAPFAPQFLEHRVLRKRELPLKMPIASDSTVHLLPGGAAYVGADVIAGVLSSGMAYRAETGLLVDVGTNGEIVLKHGERFWGCATAAGPAFEGAGLSCGMRAGHGAISHVRLANAHALPVLDVIGDASPVGLCGTAYVDFIAQTRRVGLLRPTGRFTPEAAQHPCVRPGTHGREFVIAEGKDGQPIYISEADVAGLLQAKAAIAAGILCLLDHAGLAPADVGTLYLAGGFGFHMDIENVIRSGLLPGFRPEQVSLIGNSSLAGAYLTLVDSTALNEIKKICAQLETIELNLIPGFESCFIDQLAVPG